MLANNLFVTHLGEFKAPAAFQATEGYFVRGALVEAVGEAGDADLLPLLQLLLHPVSLVDEGESLQTADHGAARHNMMDIKIANFVSLERCPVKKLYRLFKAACKFHGRDRSLKLEIDQNSTRFLFAKYN